MSIFYSIDLFILFYLFYRHSHYYLCKNEQLINTRDIQVGDSRYSDTVPDRMYRAISRHRSLARSTAGNRTGSPLPSHTVLTYTALDIWHCRPSNTYLFRMANRMLCLPRHFCTAFPLVLVAGNVVIGCQGIPSTPYIYWALLDVGIVAAIKEPTCLPNNLRASYREKTDNPQALEQLGWITVLYFTPMKLIYSGVCLL